MNENEIIVEIGAAGGSITLYGLRTESGWLFSREVIDSTPLLLPEEFPEGVIHHSSSVVDSWEEALKLLDRYPWHRLYPLRVHPEFRQKIWVEVQRRLSSEGDNEGLEHEIGLWRRVLFRP
jgi:hypothetical protein